MKILYLTGQIKYQGGIEKVLSMKMNALAEHFGHDVYLITYEQGGKDFVYPISSKVHYYDFQLNYDVAIHKKGLFAPRNIIKGIKHLFLLKKALKEINPDVVILPNGGYDFFYLPFIAKHIPKIREIHSSLYQRAFKAEGLKQRIMNVVDIFFEKRYTSIVVLNEDEKSFVHNKHVGVIPNPIELSYSQKLQVVKQQKVIAAGRLCWVKGYDNLIKAWTIVHERIPQLELDIYGGGESDYVTYLKQCIKECNLQKVVHLKGSVPDLKQVLPEYSLFVCSSHTECFPMVLLEAMSCGVPVVSYDCPSGPRNIISDKEDGFLVADQDINALAERIIFYFSSASDKQQMQTAACNKTKTFEINHVMNLWLNWINQNIQWNIQ